MKNASAELHLLPSSLTMDFYKAPKAISMSFVQVLMLIGHIAEMSCTSNAQEELIKSRCLSEPLLYSGTKSNCSVNSKRPCPTEGRTDFYVFLYIYIHASIIHLICIIKL